MIMLTQMGAWVIIIRCGWRGPAPTPIMFIWLFYAVCFVFRAVEYFVVRTDQGIIGEAFIHKLIGIGLLAIAIHIWGCKWRDIGFRADNARKGVCYGLLFGAAVYALAYAADIPGVTKHE